METSPSPTTIVPLGPRTVTLPSWTSTLPPEPFTEIPLAPTDADDSLLEYVDEDDPLLVLEDVEVDDENVDSSSMSSDSDSGSDRVRLLWVVVLPPRDASCPDRRGSQSQPVAPGDPAPRDPAGWVPVDGLDCPWSA